MKLSTHLKILGKEQGKKLEGVRKTQLRKIKIKFHKLGNKNSSR